MAVNIFIGNLDQSVRAEDLRKLFNGFGTVLEAKLATDETGNKPLGYANVYIAPDDAAREAIEELNLAPLKGRPVRMRECRFRARGERRINKYVWRSSDRRHHADRRHEPGMTQPGRRDV